MRKFLSVLITLAIAFTALYILNAAAMYVFYDINVIDPIDMVNARSDPESPEEAAAPEAGFPGNGGNGSSDGKAKKRITEDALLYTDDFVKQLSLNDKITAAAILSKVDREALSRIYDISRDGITFDEFDEIWEAAGNYLEPSDIETLREMFYRSTMTYAGSSDN